MLVNKSDAQLPVFILHLDQRRLNIVAALGTKQLHSSIDLLRVLIAPFGQCLFWGIWGIFQHCLRRRPLAGPRAPVPSSCARTISANKRHQLEMKEAAN